MTGEPTDRRRDGKTLRGIDPSVRATKKGRELGFPGLRVRAIETREGDESKRLRREKAKME